MCIANTTPSTVPYDFAVKTQYKFQVFDSWRVFYRPHGINDCSFLYASEKIAHVAA